MEEWVKRRACTVADLHLFFSLDPKDERKAKNICVDCSVKEPCLEFALKHSEHGVWGGTTDRQRNRIRIRRYADSVALASFSLHNNTHAPAHPSGASPFSLSCISFQESRNLLASQNLAALRFPSSPEHIAS